MSEFADVPLIDCHVHIKNMNALSNILEIGRQCSIQSIGIVNVAHTNRETLDRNTMTFLLKAMEPQKVYAFGGLDYRFAELSDFASQAKTLIEAGYDGMKMIEGKPDRRKLIGLSLASPLYNDYYAFLETEQIPIVYHVADPEEFWDPRRVPGWAKKQNWFWGNGGYPTKEDLYKEVDELLQKFPDLQIIFAHFYFLSADLDRASRFLDAHAGVSFDLTPGTEMYYNFNTRLSEWQKFFVKYQDRIVFGTDNTGKDDHVFGDRKILSTELPKEVKHIHNIRMFLETDQEFQAWRKQPIRGLKLETPILEKIYYKNFQRYANVKPRPLDITKAAVFCEDQLLEAKKTAGPPEIVTELEKIIIKLRELCQGSPLQKQGNER